MSYKSIPWHPEELATLNGYSLTYYAKQGGRVVGIQFPGGLIVNTEKFIALGGKLPKRVRTPRAGRAA